METIYIYTLSDPRDSAIRYVGQAKDPKKRLEGHGHSEGTGKSEWIKALRELHLRPILTVVDECQVDEAVAKEKHWIEQLASEGQPLLNHLHMPRHKVVPPSSFSSGSITSLVSFEALAEHGAVTEIITASQAAVRLGVTKGWVLRLLQDGRLPAIKRETPAGGYWEIRAEDLDAVRGLKHTGRPPRKTS